MNKLTDPVALDALQTLHVEGNVASITIGDIGESFQPLKSFMAAMGGKWNKKAGGFVFDRDFESTLEAAQVTGEFNKKEAKDFFATSPEMAAHLVRDLELFTKFSSLGNKVLHEEGFVLRVLEPSAGHGALVEAFIKDFEEAFPGKRYQIDCCELDPFNANVLRSKGFNVIHEGDFLQFKPAQTDQYHVVLMNPPFSLKGQPDCYIDHVMHAMEHCLAETKGSEIAAITPRESGGASLSPKKARFNNVLAFNFAERIKDGLFNSKKAFQNVGASVLTTALHMLEPSLDIRAKSLRELQDRISLFSLELSSGALINYYCYIREGLSNRAKRDPDTLMNHFQDCAAEVFRRCLTEGIFVDYSNIRAFTQCLAHDTGMPKEWLHKGGAFSDEAPLTKWERSLVSAYYRGVEVPESLVSIIEPLPNDEPQTPANLNLEPSVSVVEESTSPSTKSKAKPYPYLSQPGLF